MKKIIFGATLFFLCVILTGCDYSFLEQKNGQEVKKGSVSQAKDVLIGGSLYNTDKGKKLVISATDISAGQIKQKSAFVKSGEKVANLFSGNGFVASADVSSIAGASQDVATLPKNTKRIKFIDNHQFLFLSDTDDQDHAKSLNLYDVTTGKSTVLYQAQLPWGIDEYVLSPDKKMAALWEAQIPDGSTQLLGGQSKVTQVNIQTKKNQTILGPQIMQNLKDEKLDSVQMSLDASVCIQYPLFYDAKNALWLDTFCPNAGGLWGAGIYQIAQGGTLTRNSILTGGSYSFDPVLSEDGNYILIIRPKERGDASKVGVNHAINNPAELSVILASSGVEQKVKVPDGLTFSNKPIISSDGKLIAFTAFPSADDAKNQKNEKIYIIERDSGKAKSSSISETNYPLEFTRQDKAVVLGAPQNKVDSVANTLVSDAGSKYNPIFTAYAVVSTEDPSSQEKVTASNASEYIGAQSMEGAAPAISTPAEGSQASDEENNLKVGAQDFRNGLAEQRLNQQNGVSGSSGPNSATKEECEVAFPGFSSAKTVSEMRAVIKAAGLQGGDPGSILIGKLNNYSPNSMLFSRCAFSSFNNCEVKQQPDMIYNFKSDRLLKCYDSPLYLYPKSSISITINSSALPYASEPKDLLGTWKVLADSDGTIQTRDGKTYNKISYDYQSDAKPLGTGIIASQANLKQILSDYADKLGLNQKEKIDFVSFWTEKVKDAPFVQISHYSRAESSRILQLTIEPKPDTFIPIVMYFKKLSSPVKLPGPIFESVLERKGFTALDWSGVVN